jgi:hypothetical protein
MFASILVLPFLSARALDDDDKTEYAGQMSASDYDRIVKNKHRTLEIQGGFPSKLSGYGGAGPWDETATFDVGDTIDMEFHIGVKEIKMKISGKAGPSPEPVLHLKKDGKEFRQIKFTKGAC